MKRKLSTRFFMAAALSVSTASFVYVNVDAALLEKSKDSRVEIVTSNALPVAEEEPGNHSNIAPAAYLLRLAGKLVSVPR